MQLQGRDLQIEMRGEDVKLLQTELAQLGFEIPDDERNEAFFGPGTREAVVKFQDMHQLERSGVVDRRTAAAINQNFDDALPYRVSGRIVGAQRRGLRGVRAVVVDKSIGREELLGETTTDERGSYEVHYAAAPIRERGKEKPDLQVKLFAGRDQERPLALSTVRYNAGPKETIDVEVPADAMPTVAEYERLAADLTTHLNGQGSPPGDPNGGRFGWLQEDDERQDITYLANKSGWDARMVAMAALADQFGQQSGVEPELMYALFRAGLPANEAVLSRTSGETVVTLWKQAVETAVIPPGFGDQIDENLSRFSAYSAGRLLEASPVVGLSSLKELLANTLDDGERQQRFAQLYNEQRGDLDAFWGGVREEFGEETADRLQLDGRLSLLTVNNAALVNKLHQTAALQSPLSLVQQGLYQRDAWTELLDGVEAPKEIPGANVAQKKANYADFMANQLKLSYPTAVVAEMVNRDQIVLTADAQVKANVYQFLTDNQGQFELGVHPVQHYLKRNNLELDEGTLVQVKTLQRLYQISPSDEALGKLIERNVDSALAVVRYDEQDFVERFQDDLGGAAAARLTYAKAHQVHHAVLNIATSFVLDRAAPGLHAIVPAANGNGERIMPAMGLAAEDVIAYPTLEQLFGEMDYCACDHCRSVLSPAAYLVDLLTYIDAPEPEDENPLEVLLARRPDIQHLQLTCENTNTVLPYIDLVNEILEYFVVNNFSLADFEGFNIEEGVGSEDLLANPQFVNDAAYAELLAHDYPLRLPFHQPLAALRRYFDHFERPLHEALTRLRQNDDLERASADEYAWRDILMERLGLSRQHHAILTDSAKSLQELYGEDPGDSDDELVATLANVRTFARKVNLRYEEVVESATTQFINSNSYLIPKLERLGVSLATIHDFHEGTISAGDFEALLPEELDPAGYGGESPADVVQWVEDNYDAMMGLIVLSDPTGSGDLCSFEQLEFRYALPDFDNNELRPTEFLKLLRFIRLWKQLGWTIDQTDKSIAALYPAAQQPQTADDEATVKGKLDEGFKVLLLRLGHLQDVVEALGLNLKRELLPLLALWSPLDTHGRQSLYRQMFLNPAILKLDDVFKEDGYGNYLQDAGETIAAHSEALRAAFNLTQEELALILAKLGFDETTVLNLENVSHVFRHGYLARLLRLSVREVLALLALSGLDPFAPPDPVQPDTVQFIELARRIKAAPLKISQLLYFLQHEDLTGKASPMTAEIRDFMRRVREDLRRIDREQVVEDDPTGEISRNKMALVYGNEVADTFFGLLKNTSPFTVSYTHGQPTLQAAITNASGRIAYDHFRKQLAFRGVMTQVERVALKVAAGTPAAFDAAVDHLFNAGQTAFKTFFDRFPALRTLYANFVASTAPEAEKMTTLLATFLPDLRAKLKRQQVRQTVSAEVGAELSLVNALLETPALLHAISLPTKPAIEDFLNVATEGVYTSYYYADDVIGVPNLTATLPGVDYRPQTTPLPPNPAGGTTKISGVWRWLLQVPDNGFYNFLVEADGGAEVSLTLDGVVVVMALNSGIWQNQTAIELKAGQMVRLNLTVKKVKDRLVLKWGSLALGRDRIPAVYLYPTLLTERFGATYLRLLKALAIAEELGLAEAEVRHFGAAAAYQVNGRGWLNALPTTKVVAATATTRALFSRLAALLRYGELKAALKVKDERLVGVLANPAATNANGDSLLLLATGWQQADLDALLTRFGLVAADLSALDNFIRVKEAADVVKKLGIGAAALLPMITNNPQPETVRNLQAVLRARYDDAAWRKVIQPINDDLRGRQRDALVAYTLFRLGQDVDSAHVDTPDKLFEYFLIDVEMDPCMKTSRIKQAISTVQLFIQRCLLNLEPRVVSADIKAKWWPWMKRYRVWEANRKVFLFPENWLEPELRDDKSSFFKDLESELLQADITDDAAATALVHYLEKLDEVAKLEICGMYYEEGEAGNPADDVVHVIGRTAGARRSYHYRRRTGISWSPWEKIELQIEDNPIIPVVWKGRLFIFWLSVRQEPPPGQQGTPAGSDTTNLASITVSDLKSSTANPQVRVMATLNWSEYTKGKWQAARTSDPNRPIHVSTAAATGETAFDRNKLWLASTTNSADELSLWVIGGGGWFPNAFKLFNTHSLPIRAIDNPDYILDISSFVTTRYMEFSSGHGPLKIEYTDYSGESPETSFSRDVLGKSVLHEIVQPRHPVADVFAAPFFFQDRRHVFYVRSVEDVINVGNFYDFGIFVNPPEYAIPLYPEVAYKPDLADFVSPLVPVWNPPTVGLGVVDSSPVENFLEQNQTVNQAMKTTGTIQYGNKVIGPGGALKQ